MGSVDVVVIGAGPSGLHAAQLLGRAGRSVVVLEGRLRIGGRVFSPGGLDVGPSWFWANERRINHLVEAFGLESFPQHLAGDALFQNDDGVQRVNGNPIDAPSSRLAGGMHALVAAMASSLDSDTLRLGEVVRAVRPSGAGLDVETAKDVWSAPTVIVALPPATAVSSIDFGDALASDLVRVATETPVWMGQMTKVVARYSTPFWRKEGLAGSAFSHAGPMRELHDMSGPRGLPAAIFGFAQPKPGDPAPTEKEVVEQLVDLFGPGARHVDELVVHDWRTEGLTSPSGVEGLTMYQLFGHPIYQSPCLEGRLHWASTETSVIAPGHIEGALAAAERAVRAIVDRSIGG